MIISIIVALAENGAIGKNNQLLWRLSNDLRWFKKNTLGKPIIMGRKTYQSIGKALPGRLNIIVTRNNTFEAPGCVLVTSFDAALEAANGFEEVMVIGGSEVYALALPKTQRLYITRVQGTFDADAYFPELDWQSWQEVFRQEHLMNEPNSLGYTFQILER